MNFKSIIDQKDKAAKFMLREITYIFKNLGKRNPGSEGEKKACEHMAKVLRDKCGCEDVQIESFTERPGAFYGWMLFIVAIIHVSLIPDKNAQQTPIHSASSIPYCSPSVSSQSAADELKKYKELKDQGVITEEEFQAKKEQLLKLM